MIDGSGGQVWKPISEGNGFPVLLMPTEFCAVDNVDIYGGDVKKSDMSLKDCHEFGRGVWRGAPHCYDLPDNAMLVFEFPDGHTECRTIPDPCTRYD